MGECLISRRGGEAYSLPVLNASYPQNVAVMASANGTASFSVVVSEHGRPAEYTYQWYVNGTAVSGATSANYTRSTTVSNVGTFTIYCDVTNKAGTVSSKIATLVVKNAIPTSYTYSGSHKLVKDSDYDWTLFLYSSGDLVLNGDYKTDIFLNGGGGGGGNSSNPSGGGGGGGGYITTKSNVSLAASTVYKVTIGAGGSAASTGGSTSISTLGYSASGGAGGTNGWTGTAGGAGTGKGGNGGGSTGAAGTNGADGQRPFGSYGSVYYGAGGGGGGGVYNGGAQGGKTGGGSGGWPGNAGTANTGGGGGGGSGSNEDPYTSPGGAGGSGIVIIRNTR